jgi:hypothetical protein
MPKVKISEYSSTANSNTDVASINIDEGCAPSGINNAIRAVMGHLKDFQTGAVSDPLTVGGVLTVTGGSAGTPAITTSGDTNTGIFFPAADTIAFSEGGTESARIDSGGNFGLGVTPAAWGSPFKALQFGPNGGALIARTDANQAIEFSLNWYYDGAATKYINSNYATRYRQFAGAHEWYTAAFGTAGNAITFTQAMTLDASGNLGLGITNPTAYAGFQTLEVGTGGAKGGLIQLRGASSTVIAQQWVDTTSTQYWTGTTTAHPYVFATSGTERARIDSSGNFLVKKTTADDSSQVGFLAYAANGAVTSTLDSANLNSFHLYNKNATNNGYRFYVNTNGGITNFAGNNVNISDARTKHNIENAGSYLEKICAIPVHLFNYKDEPLGEQKTLGVIAQEVELVAPELVSNIGFGDIPEDGIPLKTVYQTDLQYALMKCIQEQQALITSLTARITALEGN